MFIAALFTVTKRRKQPKCPLTDKQIYKIWHTHNRLLFSLENEGNSDTYYGMDKPWRYYVKWDKPVTKIQIQYDST